jgi:hypothetical protein
MTTIINNEVLLNFCFLTTSYCKFIKKSSENFKEIINNQELKQKNSIDKLLNNEKESTLKKAFNDSNYQNFMDYTNNQLLLDEDNEETKNDKLKFIIKILGIKSNSNIDENTLIIKTIESLNSSILCDSDILVNLLSGHTMNYIFDVFELLKKLLETFEVKKTKEIQELTTKNLLNEESLYNNNKKLLNEKNVLKDKINHLNNIINNNKKQYQKLMDKNNDLESVIKKMNESLNALRTSIELNEKKFNSELKNLKEELANSKNELKIKNTQHAQEVIILKEKIEYLSASNLQLNEEMKTMANTNAKLNEEMKTMANTNAKLNEEINVLKKKVATLEENYDYMKALNLQIILDATKKNNEKEESKETNVNAYIRLLNLLSSDYCLLESKLKEKDGEIFRLKNELKGK